MISFPLNRFRELLSRPRWGDIKQWAYVEDIPFLFVSICDVREGSGSLTTMYELIITLYDVNTMHEVNPPSRYSDSALVWVGEITPYVFDEMTLHQRGHCRNIYLNELTIGIDMPRRDNPTYIRYGRSYVDYIGDLTGAHALRAKLNWMVWEGECVYLGQGDVLQRVEGLIAELSTKINTAVRDYPFDRIVDREPYVGG